MGFPIFQSLERGKDIPQPIEIDIGKCLRFCRSVYCLTPKDVADQIGVPLQTLRQYEQGKGHIPCYMLWTLSNFLRVPVARFFEFEQAAQHDHNNFFWCEDEVLSGEDDEEEDDGNYHVKGPRPISAAGAKYKTGRKALAEAKKAEEARAARKKAQGKSKKK